MTELSQKQNKYLDFLIADFNAIKLEIARRSNLQRVLLAAYIAMLAIIFNEFTKANFSLVWICGLWVGVTLAQIFYQRERLEIERLGRIVKKRIAKEASEILERDQRTLLHSQTNSQFNEINRQTHPIDRLFHWAIFFIIPILLTIYSLFQHIQCLGNLLQFSTSTPWKALIVIILCFINIFLLCKYDLPIQYQNKES